MDDILKPSDYIKNIFEFSLNERIAELINLHSSIVTLFAGYTVLREGEKAYCCYLVLSGVVRGYYIDKHGNDISKCFSSENEFFSSEGLREGVESSFTIECIEDCRCIKLPYELIRQLSIEDGRIKTFISQLYSNEVYKVQSRVKNLMLMSAEERYNDFCEHFPHLQNRIPLKHIASYINVRAASLSRIRKRMKKASQN